MLICVPSGGCARQAECPRQDEMPPKSAPRSEIVIFTYVWDEARAVYLRFERKDAFDTALLRAAAFTPGGTRRGLKLGLRALDAFNAGWRGDSIFWGPLFRCLCGKDLHGGDEKLPGNLLVAAPLNPDDPWLIFNDIVPVCNNAACLGAAFNKDRFSQPSIIARHGMDARTAFETALKQHGSDIKAVVSEDFMKLPTFLYDASGRCVASRSISSYCPERIRSLLIHGDMASLHVPLKGIGDSQCETLRTENNDLISCAGCGKSPNDTYSVMLQTKALTSFAFVCVGFCGSNSGKCYKRTIELLRAITNAALDGGLPSQLAYDPSSIPLTCDYCRKPEKKASDGSYETKLRLCSRCNAACYCSKDCQIAHWPTHKPVCFVPKLAQQ